MECENENRKKARKNDPYKYVGGVSGTVEGNPFNLPQLVNMHHCQRYECHKYIC